MNNSFEFVYHVQNNLAHKCMLQVFYKKCDNQPLKLLKITNIKNV